MNKNKSVKLFFCGDVMTGRGIDQVLPYPSDPILYESYVKDARYYVKIAKDTNGAFPHPVEFDYIWGNALPEILKADARIINLETSITTSESHADKGINYRMHPNNIDFLKVAQIDCCSLANNHILDWGTEGLLETMSKLNEVNVGYAGAGKNSKEAQSPDIVNLTGKGRVLIFAFGLLSSGIPLNWKASANEPGINMITDFSPDSIKRIQRHVELNIQPGDIVVASLHWGGNWGYEIPEIHRKLAHDLIDQCHVDIIHGHSSHHFKGIEVYKNRPILYGCGDFLNDYEGIKGHEAYRDDLGLMYFVSCSSATGELVSLEMVPTRIKRMQITEPNSREKHWIKDVLISEGKALNTSAHLKRENSINLIWY